MGLVAVHSPETEPEIAVIVAMLEAYDIPCFVHARYFGSIYPGIQVNAYNTQTIMVPEACLADALDLLTAYRNTDGHAAMPAPWKDKIRIVLEGFFLGWFIPPVTRRGSEE